MLYVTGNIQRTYSIVGVTDSGLLHLYNYIVAVWEWSGMLLKNNYSFMYYFIEYVIKN